jgi:hypothetical protein
MQNNANSHAANRKQQQHPRTRNKPPHNIAEFANGRKGGGVQLEWETNIK